MDAHRHLRRQARHSNIIKGNIGKRNIRLLAKSEINSLKTNIQELVSASIATIVDSHAFDVVDESVFPTTSQIPESNYNLTKTNNFQLEPIEIKEETDNEWDSLSNSPINCERNNYLDKDNNNLQQEQLNEIIKQQNEILQNQKTLLDTCKALQVQMLNMQEQNKKQLAKFQTTLDQLKSKNAPSEHEFHFPIDSEERLEEIEKKIEQEFEKYVSIIMVIILPEGLMNNLNRLFSLELIMDFNYSGVQGKKAFASYIKLNKALYEALKHEGYTYNDYTKDIRSAFKSFKDKQYKKVYKARQIIKANQNLEESLKP